SLTLQPSSIPKDREFGVVISFSADFISDGSDVIDFCEFFKRIAMGAPTPKGGGGSSFADFGPNLAVQIQRKPVGEEGNSTPGSTVHPAINERMFDILDFDGNIEEGPFRYEVSRVLTTDDAETEIHLMPFSTVLGSGLKGAPPNSFHSVFTDEITGATTVGPSGSVLPGKRISFKISDFVGEAFAGSWIVDTSQALAVVADYAYPNQRYSSVLGIRTYEPSGFVPNSETAWAPLLQEPGWETEVTLNNVDRNDINTIVVELKDSIGNTLDQREVMIDPLEKRTVTFSPTLLHPESRAGLLFVRGDENFVGQVRQVKRGTGGEVLDVISYNLIEEDVSAYAETYAPTKGIHPVERGGADVLAIPWVQKPNPTTGVGTDIILSNLNPNPGLTSAKL
ncbi:MAG: hypothetical protein KC978_24155, partial [Candidatus Omnitrophica bacterium]|nr:hypothetical protein [Candidatus Omnitrophota bacterium]